MEFEMFGWMDGLTLNIFFWKKIFSFYNDSAHIPEFFSGSRRDCRRSRCSYDVCGIKLPRLLCAGGFCPTRAGPSGQRYVYPSFFTPGVKKNCVFLQLTFPVFLFSPNSHPILTQFSPSFHPMFHRFHPKNVYFWTFFDFFSCSCHSRRPQFYCISPRNRTADKPRFVFDLGF